ncbi:hypothetical protein JW916_15930 [Candidatus Sumerlaeota bacterium]|nr:hypothetical protein [Candidatus Sumerlaeota bacterium]
MKRSVQPPRAPRRAFLLVAALAWGIVSTAAAQSSLVAKLDVLGAQADDPYVYAVLKVQNNSARRMGYNVDLSESYRHEFFIRDRSIEPGEERTHHLSLLVGRRGYGGISASVMDSNGQTAVVHGGTEERSFLNVCDIDAWASEKEVQDFSNAIAGGASSPGYPHRYGGASKIVAQVEPSELPDDWLCYAPYRAVLVGDSAYRRISAESRRALLQWVDGGGNLLIYGSTEPRNEKRLLGTIVFQSANPVKSSTPGDVLPSEFRHASPPWKTFLGRNTETLRSFPYHVMKRTGAMGGLIIATLFFVVAGPVNYLYFRRGNRIRGLLVSVPVLSLSFCLMITLYFVFTQGFARKGGTVSVTILDESLDSVFTFARHCVLSGLYPAGGFQFERETAFYPVAQMEDDPFTMDLTRGRRLTSGFFKPSVNFHYFSAMPYTTRERLIYDAETSEVGNGFELPIRALALFDGGSVFVAGAIPPGGKAHLEPVDTRAESRSSGSAPLVPGLEEVATLCGLDEAEKTFGFSEMQPLYGPIRERGGTQYAIVFDGNLLSVQQGVRIRGDRNLCVLFGLMEGASETTSP